MRKTLAGIAGIAAIATLIGPPASAADMPLKALPPAPAWSWTGCHVGIEGGGSWANSDGYFVDAASTIAGGPTAFTGPLSTSLSGSGPTAGVYAGCDYQMNNWVIGFEGDWSALSQSSTGGPNPASAAFLNPLDFWTQQLDWFATLRARLGYTVYNNWLLYVTGGAAWMEVQTTTGITGVPASTLTQTDTPFGWTVGAGIECALSHGFTLRAEYLFIGMPTYRTFTPGSGSATALAGDFLNIGVSRISDNIFRVGVDYTFAPWAAPVGAGH